MLTASSASSLNARKRHGAANAVLRLHRLSSGHPSAAQSLAPCGHSLFRAQAESSAPGTGPCGPRSRPSAAPFPPAGKKEGFREEKRRKRERLEYPSLRARLASACAQRRKPASCGTQPLRRAFPRPEDQTFRLVPRPEGLSSGLCRAVPSSARAVCPPRVKRPDFGHLPQPQGPEDKRSAPPRRSLRLRFPQTWNAPALFRARSSRSAPGLRGLTGRAKAPKLRGPGATAGSCGPAHHATPSRPGIRPFFRRSLRRENCGSSGSVPSRDRVELSGLFRACFAAVPSGVKARLRRGSPSAPSRYFCSEKHGPGLHRHTAKGPSSPVFHGVGEVFPFFRHGELRNALFRAFPAFFLPASGTRPRPTAGLSVSLLSHP